MSTESTKDAYRQFLKNQETLRPGTKSNTFGFGNLLSFDTSEAKAVRHQTDQKRQSFFDILQRVFQKDKKDLLKRHRFSIFFWKNLKGQAKWYSYLGLAGGILLALFLAWKLYQFVYDQQIFSALHNTRTVTSDSIMKDKNLSALNQLITLPDQSVTVGVIADTKSLASKQPYFSKVRNGDLLLLYPDKTVIYDPVNKYVVDIHIVHLLK